MGSICEEHFLLLNRLHTINDHVLNDADIKIVILLGG